MLTLSSLRASRLHQPWTYLWVSGLWSRYPITFEVGAPAVTLKMVDKVTTSLLYNLLFINAVIFVILNIWTQHTRRSLHQSLTRLSENICTWVRHKIITSNDSTDPHLSRRSDIRTAEACSKDLHVPEVILLQIIRKNPLQRDSLSQASHPFSEHPCHLIESHQSRVNIDIIESEQTSSAMNLPLGFGALITGPKNVWGRRPSSNFKDRQ